MTVTNLPANLESKEKLVNKTENVDAMYSIIILITNTNKL